MKFKFIDLFLRFSLAISFLSAVADRFGLWPTDASSWGNWKSFEQYTAVLLPFLPAPLTSITAIVATLAEVVLAVLLLVGFKTNITAKLTGVLLLLFALAMTFSVGVKAPLDYSVYTASAAAFALAYLNKQSESE